jgi:N-acetylglucosamine-6-phosphate deacetylase
MPWTLRAQRLFTPFEAIDHPQVVIEGGVITKIRSGESVEPATRNVDFGDAIIVPGFIDIHIHGGGGRDVMEDDAAALPAVESVLARHGVTAYFPTTVTAPLETTLRALERLGNAIESAANATRTRQSSSQRALPLGIHLEGPFISHARRGVHPPTDLLPPRLETFERFWEASRGQIKLMTIAPELAGAPELIAEASRRGVCVSLGHSDATLAETERGITAGARHATHTFNAMRPLGHRDPGILGAALVDDRLTADVIADGIHLDPMILELFLRAKGSERAVLITDAIAATGMPDGRYRLGSLEVEVQNGRCTSDGKLAGSVLTMDRAIHNIANLPRWNLQMAIQLATANPARVVGQELRGRLAPGMAADMVILNKDGSVQKTIVNGVLDS